MVCGNAKSALKLNESESTKERYILEGLFAGPFGVENRNKRIYQVDEYLKHLQYLRDDIKKGEPLLGELDHPDDRFEIKLKDVSHRVIDIWYDKASNTIQGKIELLNTPNGKLAQSLVDQGIPLHISSRAAGSVNSDKTVSINQIYTFDLVCKPGFAGAVLHRVNESEDATQYTDDVKQFLAESEKMESLNAAPQFGMMNEDVSITEVSADVKLRDEAKSIKENNNNDDMTNNEDVKNVVVSEEEVEKTEATVENQEVSEKEEEKVEDDKAEEENNDSEENNDDDTKEDDAEDKGVEIISVKADTGSDEEEVEIEDVKAEDDEEKSEEEDKEDEDKESEEDEAKEDETSECDNAECKDDNSECDKSDDADEKKAVDTDDKEKEMLLDCDELKDKRNKFEDKIDELIDAIKTKSEKAQTNESHTINKYPISSLLNESNFKEFMGLNESEKNNVITYLQDNKMLTIDAVNENWKQGINYECNEEVWLKYAPGNYKQLYENASEQTKASIRATASMLLFENQYDVNNFWENTGLADAASRNILNENFINNMPKIVTESETNELPYSKDFIKAVTEMACEYN